MAAAVSATPPSAIREAVLSDVINEWVTVDHARNTYKVVVDKEARTIDWDATNELRGDAAGDAAAALADGE